MSPGGVADHRIHRRALGQVIFTQNRDSEFMYLLYFDLSRDAPVVRDIRPPILLLFALVAVTFVPSVSSSVNDCRRFATRGRPLVGYALDLLGSFTGVLAFAMASFRGFFPVTWFAVASLVGIWLARGNRRRLSVLALVSAIALVVIERASAAIFIAPTTPSG